MKPSRKYELNQKDIKDILVMGSFTALAAFGVFVVDQVLPNVDFGKFAPYVTPLIPVVTYTVKKWAQGR